MPDTECRLIRRVAGPLPATVPALGLSAAPSDAAAHGYRAGADAPEKLRADFVCFRAWCPAEGSDAALSAPPDAVGAYLASLAPRHRMPPFRRWSASRRRPRATA